MKRDMDLVRKIAIELGDSRHELEASLFTDERHGYQDVAHHMLMMEEAGLITARKQGADNEWAYFAAVGLTWKGNEFLAAATDEKVWKRVMLDVAKRTGGVPFTVLTPLLQKALEASFGIGS